MGIYRSKLEKVEKQGESEPKTTYDMVEMDEVDFSKLPDNIIFKHDKQYSF
jgi:hypothetical protein